MDIATPNLADPVLTRQRRWWMPGVLVSAITIALGLALTVTREVVGVPWFGLGSAGWWILTTLLHLPFLGILFFLVVGIVERLGFNWRGRAAEQPGTMPPVYPTVCVQLPMFSEHAVARRVIEAAANMRWPADRLVIQVLDDSADEVTRRLVEKVAEEMRARGHDCRVLHRANRQGYKAGALEAGRRQSDAEFLVIFDADFVPPEDFLMRAIPHFYRPDGEPDTRLALVQTQWGHLNHDQSALTLAQSLWIDDHHTLQMAWRSAVCGFVNFTGTAGVWRAAAIEAAGGWRAASLVEDGELSFRVLFAGYRTKFVKEIVVPAELPATYTAYKAQQKRWTQGWTQVQRLHLRTLLFKHETSGLRRLQLFYLMCISWQWPLWAAWMLLLPFAIVTNHWIGAFGLGWGSAAYLLPSVLWLTVSAASAAIWTRNTYSERLTARTFLGRFGRAFPLAGISTGMLAHQVCAFVEGLFGPMHAEFERTPKVASVTRRDTPLIRPDVERAPAVRRIDQVKIHWPCVVSESFFVVFQLAWALIFLISGFFLGALAATLVAWCTLHLAYFYGDHAGKVCFVLDRHALLTPERIQDGARALGSIAFVLVLLSTGSQLLANLQGEDLRMGLAPFFHVDMEQNFPTYFSVLLILFAAYLLSIIALRARQLGSPQVSQWAVLACGFFLMALDEALQIHERLNLPIGRLLGGGDLGIFYFPWVIPAIPLVLLLGMYFMGFLSQLPAKTRLRFVIAAIMYLGGAIGVELLGSRLAGMHGYGNLTYNLIATLEESLEMAGLIIFVWALLSHYAERLREVAAPSVTTA